MTKNEFMKVLVQRLRGLPQAEIDKSLGYYDEIISDRMEDGMSEEEAVAALGDVEEIAQNILHATPLPTLVKARVDNHCDKNNSNKILWVLILILTFPIWISALGVAFGLFVGLIGTIFGLLVALIAILFSIAAAAVAIVIGAIAAFLTGNVGAGMCYLGGGLFFVGLFLLLTQPVKAACKGLSSGVHWVCHKIKSLFVPKNHPANTEDVAPEAKPAKEVL